VSESERTAILVIRAWLGENRSQLRARILEAPSTASQSISETTAVGDDEVLAAVVRWLRKLAEHPVDGRSRS
jgi:hypothetical protein